MASSCHAAAKYKVAAIKILTVVHHGSLICNLIASFRGVLHGQSQWGFPMGFPMGITHRDSPWGIPMGIPHGETHGEFKTIQPLQTTSCHVNPTIRCKSNHFKPLQATSTPPYRVNSTTSHHFKPLQITSSYCNTILCKPTTSDLFKRDFATK